MEMRGQTRLKAAASITKKEKKKGIEKDASQQEKVK